MPCPNEKPPRRCAESSKVTQRLRLVKYDFILQNTVKVCKGKGLYCVFSIKVNDSMTDSVGHSHTYSTDIRRLQLLQGGPGAHSPSLTFQRGSEFGTPGGRKEVWLFVLCLNLPDVLLQTVTHRFWTMPETLGCTKDINCRWDHCHGPWEVHQPHCQYREPESREPCRSTVDFSSEFNRGIPECQWYGAERIRTSTLRYLWYDLIWYDDMIWTW